MKRDSTPEFNSSYHYNEDNIQFDSPEPPCVTSNNELTVPNFNLNTDNVSKNNSPKSTNHLFNEDLQPSNTENNLPESEPEMSTSRRDTYSINIEPIATPAPRRSILKCSKTARTNRSRSSCRMVQFARLPKTDSKIKLSKSHLHSGSKFVVTDDEANESDLFQESKKCMQFNVEEYDDDLDGVQPLDSSVASLMNSPILDNSSLNKSSKRGSRGNKVMSLINSIESNTNKSPKHSIRASDLLSMSGSKHSLLDTSPTNSSQVYTSMLTESASSSRRINLENIFEAESSLHDSSFSKTDNEVIVSKLDNKNNDMLEKEYNFASPLNLPISSSTNNNSRINKSTFVDSKNNESIVEVPNKQEKSETNSNKPTSSLKTGRHYLEDSTRSHSTVFDKVENVSLNNTNKNQNNCSTFVDALNKVCTDDVEVQTNVSVEKTENISKTTEPINHEETPSMIIQGMSEIFNTSVEENTSNSQCNKSCNSTFILVENVDTPNSIITNDSLNAESLTSDRDLSKSVVGAIEAELSMLHGGNCSLSYSNEETILADTKLKTTLSGTVSENVESSKLSLRVNDNISVCTPSVSTRNSTRSILKTQSHADDEAYTNDSNNVNDLDVSELPVKTDDTTASVSKKCSTVNSNSFVITNSKIMESNDESSCLLHNLFDDERDIREVQNSSQNSVQNITYLDRSEEMSKSLPSILINSPVTVANVTNNKTSTKNIVEIIDIPKDDSINNDAENMNTTHKNLEKSFNTCIGKPQYESTPWNSSKNTKTHFSSTSKAQIYEIAHSDVSNVSNDKLKKRSVSPMPNPDVWSQMMKDFNESVKKASISENCIENTNTVTKVLFDQSPKSSPTAFQSKANDVPSAHSYIENNTLETKETKTKLSSSSNSTLKPSNDINEVNCSPQNINNSNLQKDINRGFSLAIQGTENDVSSTHSFIENNTLGIQEKKTKPSLSNNISKPSNDVYEVRRSPRNTNNSKSHVNSNRKALRFNKKQSKDNLEVNTSNSKCCISPSENSSPFVAKTRAKRKIVSISTDQNSDVSKIKKMPSPQVETSMPIFETDTKRPVARRKINRDMTDSEPDIKSSGRSESNTNISNSSISLYSNSKTKQIKRTKKKNSSPTLSLRRNLRGRAITNKSTKPQLKLKTISKRTSTSSDTEINSSAGSNNVSQASNKELRNKKQFLNVEQSKTTVKGTTKQTSKKNTSMIKTDSDETKSTKKSKIISLTKTRVTRSSTVVTELRLLGLEKNNKTLSPVNLKKSKVTTIKNNKSSKSNKRIQSKRILPSNPIKTNDDTSEYESLSETEENQSKSHTIDIPPKTRKNKNDKINNNTSLPAKSSNIEKVEEITPNISATLRTRGCKRAANTAIVQPNAKGQKRAASDKVASTTNSSISNSPKTNSSSNRKLTRMASKLAEQNSNNSFPETISKEIKPKPLVITRAKKREVSESSSYDSAPSAKKITRHTTRKEIKVEKSSTSTRNSSRTKVENIDKNSNNSSTKVKFNK